DQHFVQPAREPDRLLGRRCSADVPPGRTRRAAARPVRRARTRRGARMNRTALLLLALVIAPYFVRLGAPDLWDINETLYAEPPREVLETGEWLLPTLNYEPWFVKPPGVTWITLPFYAALGPSEFASRLPMALAAALTILLTFHVGRRTAGDGAGLLSALVLATMAKHFMFARQLAGDVFLALGFAVAFT